jgi:hypothetical protein
MITLTFTAKFDDTTGNIRPWEIYVKRDNGPYKICTSAKTLEGAEKSIKKRMDDRKKYFICIYEKN